MPVGAVAASESTPDWRARAVVDDDVVIGPAVHIIVMTGHDDEVSHAEAFEAGSDDFVVKPTGMSELERRLAAATRNHRAFVEVRVAQEAADRRMAYGAEASALLAHDLNNGLAMSPSPRSSRGSRRPGSTRWSTR